MSNAKLPPMRQQRAKQGFLLTLKRVGQAVAVTAVVVLSLLTFPSAIPWMAAAWLAWHTWLVHRSRAGWLPLAVCAAVLIVKGVPWLPGVITLGVVVLAAGLLGAFRARTAEPSRLKRPAWIGAALLWAAWVVMAVDWHSAARCGRPVTLHPTRPVVCLGDSLTAETSARGGYPDDLRQLIAVRVVNLGQPGITSADALERLPALKDANPQVVVVELGGHDYLRGYPRASTRASLEQIVQAARGIGAEVVLMEMPRGFITDPYHGLERELARKHDLELVPDTPIRKLVLWSPHAPPGMWVDRKRHLSDGGLHPNQRGNELLARRVADALVRLLGPEVLQHPD